MTFRPRSRKSVDPSEIPDFTEMPGHEYEAVNGFERWLAVILRDFELAVTEKMLSTMKFLIESDIENLQRMLSVEKDLMAYKYKEGQINGYATLLERIDQALLGRLKRRGQLRDFQDRVLDEWSPDALDSNPSIPSWILKDLP